MKGVYDSLMDKFLSYSGDDQQCSTFNSTKPLKLDNIPFALKTVLILTPMLSGIAGNLALIAIVACNRRVRSKPFQFMVSIAIANLCFVSIRGCLKLFEQLQEVMRLSAMYSCQVLSYSEFMIQLILVFNLTAVSLERYVVICIPFQAKRFWTRSVCRWIIIGSWITASVVATTEPMFVQQHCMEIRTADSKSFIISYCFQSWDVFGAIVLKWTRLALLFIFPLLVMSFCYTNVIYYLWRTTALDMDLAHTTVRKMLSKQSSNTGSIGTVTSCVKTLEGTPADSIQNLQTIGTAAAVAGGSSAIIGGGGGGVSMQKLALFNQRQQSKVSLRTIPSLTGDELPTTDLKRVKRTLANDVRRVRRRVVKILILVVISFVACWGPKLILDVQNAMRQPMNMSLNFTKALEQLQWNMSSGGFNMEWLNLNETSLTFDGSDGAALKMEKFGESSHLNQANYLALVSDAALLLHSTIDPLICMCLAKDLRRSITKCCA